MAASRWSASTALTKGRYRVTVVAVASAGAKAAASATKAVTIK